MYKTIVKLSDSQRDTLISGFLTKLGERLALRRQKRNYSQNDLAECLDIDRTTISKYEHGETDMPVSKLPLFSTYCNFPMYELFPEDESKAILDSFAKAVSITVDRKKRQEKLRRKKTVQSDAIKKTGHKKILKGQLFEIDGKDVLEPVPPKKPKPVREQYRDAEIRVDDRPYSDMEFYNYVTTQGMDLTDAVISAGRFLDQIDDLPNKETLKGAVADYIIDEIVIESISRKHPDEAARRAYAYYRMLYRNTQEEHLHDDE